VLGEYLGGGPSAEPVPRRAEPSLTDERLREVGELGQVPGGAD